MAILDLHLLGSPVLRERSAEVPGVDAGLRRLIDSLFETMEAAGGIGLAANQVGVAQRVAVVDVDHTRLVLVNPVVLSPMGRGRAEEGCLSIPDAYGEVERPESIILEAADEHGNRYRREASGLLARAIQHEVDHLDGVLFIDHLGALKRQLLVTRWKKDHKGEGLVKTIRPEHARPE